MLQYLVLVGLAISLFGNISYLRDTLTGRVKPNRISFVMWAAAPLIASFAAISKGVTWAVLPVFMAGFNPLCILIASLFNKKAYWKLTAFDYLCGLFSVLALVLWAVTKEANIAIIFAIASDGFAAVPTLKKAWTNPETESAVMYSTGLISTLTSFAAVRYWVFPEYGFAAYLVIIDICLILSIYGRRILSKRFLFTGKNKV